MSHLRIYLRQKETNHEQAERIVGWLSKSLLRVKFLLNLKIRRDWGSRATTSAVQINSYILLVFLFSSSNGICSFWLQKQRFGTSEVSQTYKLCPKVGSSCTNIRSTWREVYLTTAGRMFWRAKWKLSEKVSRWSQVLPDQSFGCILEICAGSVNSSRLEPTGVSFWALKLAIAA